MNQDLCDELLEMKKRDLETRSRLREEGVLYDRYAEAMEKVHNQNARRLNEIVDEYSWPGESLVGIEGEKAAWLVAQHAIGQPAWQKKFLRLLKDAVSKGEAPALHEAYLEDRILFNQGKPQLYGLIFDWDENGQMNTNVDDVAKANEQRKQLGLATIEEDIDRWRKDVEVEGASPPTDYYEYRHKAEDWAKRVGWR